MKLAIVTGQVVATIRSEGCEGYPLMLIEHLDIEGNPNGISEVAVDPIGTDIGEWVITTSGSSARMALKQPGPIDLTIVGIVDQVTRHRSTIFNKKETR